MNVLRNKRKQRQVPGSLDCPRQASLVFRAHRRRSSRKDLSPVGNEPPQNIRLFVVRPRGILIKPAGSS
jgi:hypothetical protein